MRFTSCGQWHLIGTMNHFQVRPSTTAVARAVGWVTFLEIVRDKVLYNIILCAGLLLSIGFLASRLTFIRPERVILNFGLSGVTYSCAMIALFTGAGLLSKEFDRRTLYVALCHPISKAQFLFGKFVGLGLVIFLNWIILSSAYLIILYLNSPDGSDFTKTLYIALFLILVQTLVIASMTLFFSSFSTTSLSAIMTLGTYLIGNNITQMRQVADKLHEGAARLILKTLALILPNLEYFSLGLKVTYGLPVTAKFVTFSVLYGLSLTSVFLFAAGLLIRLKEV
jgi:Cu-processing system permease protein